MKSDLPETAIVSLTVEDIKNMGLTAWEATPELKFILQYDGGEFRQPILHQLWLDRISGDAEWRRVPEEEV